MSTLQELWQTNPIVGANDILISQLSRLRIVDIGKIDCILDNGAKALVNLLDGSGEKIKCEIISIGAGNVSIQNAIAGQYVLVLLPKTPASIQDDATDIAAQTFSTTYAKCIPIGLNINTKVGLNIGADMVSISGKSYDASFTMNSISILSDTIRLSYDAQAGKAALVAGSNHISIDANNIELITGASYDAQGSLSSFKNKVVMDSTNGMTIGGDVTIDGGLVVTQNFSAADGNLTAEV